MAGGGVTARRRRPSPFVRTYERLGQRLGASLFEEVRAGASLRPRLTPGKVAALLIAGAVHGVTLVALVGGILLIVLPWPNPGTIFLGVLCLLVGWSIRPRLGGPPRDLVGPHDAPALHDLVRRTSEHMGVRRLRGIAVSAEWNASVAQVGWRRRRYLTIGLPLLTVLGPQERVAVLAHELGHLVNGDPRRSGFLGTAMQTLVGWYLLLRPYGGARSGIVEVVLDAFLRLPRTVVVWTWAVLVHLVFRATQRAEYLADALARRVAGTEASAGAMRRMSLGSYYRQAVQTAALRPGRQTTIFDAFREHMRSDQGQEAEQVARREIRQGFRLDATHPPTAYRIRFLEARQVQPEITLSAAASAAIDDELRPLERRLQDQLIDAYRDSLYY
ncbi:MAG: M48 family metallopeptidase [Actinomycetota bacterium]